MEILHTDERRQLVIDRIILHCVELVGETRAHPNIADVSGLDDIVQRLHCLFDRSVVVEAVALEEIDVL